METVQSMKGGRERRVPQCVSVVDGIAGLVCCEGGEKERVEVEVSGLSRCLRSPFVL